MIEHSCCHLDALRSTDVGFIRLAPDGRLLAWSPGIATVLTDPASPISLPATLDEWAARLPADDRAAVMELLEALPDVAPIQCRVGSEPRWYEIRRLPHSEPDPPVAFDLLLVEQTERIEHARLGGLMLRHQRVVAEIVEALASTDTVEETTAEILASLGEHLDLRRACWHDHHDHRWTRLARWRHDGPGEEDLAAEIDLDTMADRLAGGLPIVMPTNHCRTVIAPVLVKGELIHALQLESLGEELWEPGLVDLVMRVAEAIGRRLETQIAEAEREAWAAERGALERSEAIAQLTSGVAHDFNGVLFAILGRFELLRLHTEDPKALAEIDAISQTVHEAKRLADRLRQALKGGDATDEVVTVQTELGAIVSTVGRLLPSRLEFHAAIRLPEDPVQIVTRRHTLQQIVLNLAVNARDAVGPHGRIQLGARLLPDGRLEVRVDDDGPGIRPEDRTRLLEPYETGDESDGVGLGLAICRRLAGEAGGELLLDDSPLGGLAARVCLPVRPVAPLAANAASMTVADPREVVIIEDNHIIRDVLVRVYEGLGATVHPMPHGLDLERVLAEHGDIDLLVIDIDLPHRTGIEAISDLRNLGIDIPCLLITGGLAEPPELPRLGFLRKPFKIDVLREASRRLLADTE